MLRPTILAATAAAALAACVPVAPDPGGATIPAALRGSWGLTAADCIPGRADAKGLMEVGATTLSFYESRATLTSVASRSASAITGGFAFTGEGQTWQRTVSLRLAGEDGPLVRSDQEGSYSYARCD